LRYCRPDRNKRTLLNRVFDKWGVFEYFKDKDLLIEEEVDGNKKKGIVYLVSSKVEEAAAHLNSSYSIGLAIGKLGKRDFIPSIAGADLFARYGKRNQFYIIISEKGEKLALYGRDIMGESIIEASGNLPENELVIVVNRSDEAIALGRTRFSGRLLLQRGRVTVSTITDAGFYLRGEG